MVYCGKPSKGCHACRSRKTRCDAKPEGCTQCAKARRVCPGYRSTIDVIFRDESENVIQKAKASEAKKAAAKISPGPEILEADPDRENRQSTEADLAVARVIVDGGYTMLPTLDELATCHFISQYIVGIQAPSRGVLDNLAFMHQHCYFDETLTTAVKAISYASFAHHAGSEDVDRSSRYQYTKAIGLTNSALRDPEHSTKDTTLLSILLLGMYEVITGNNQRSIGAWIQHIRGSAALLKLRGKEQLKTSIGRRLFIQANTGILTTSVQLNIPIPKVIMEMTRDLPDMIPETDDFARKAYGIHMTMLDFNQWRSAVSHGKIKNHHVVLARALELDRRLAEIYDSPTAEWAYHILSTGSTDSDVVFNRIYHIYPDLLTANLWNAVRVMRGLLHQELRQTLLAGFSARPPIFAQPEHTAQFQTSTDLCYQIQAEIFASVPQHLGYVQKPANSTGQHTNPVDLRWHPAQQHDAEMENILQAYRNPPQADVFPPATKARASGGLNLMWPLFFAGSMDLGDADARKYSASVLRRIGEDMGIRQAFVLARVTESRTDIEAWTENSSVVEDEDDVCEEQDEGLEAAG